MQDSGKSHVMIGVKMQKTRYVNSQTGSAVNEKQEILINSIKHPEVQVSLDADSSDNIMHSFLLIGHEERVISY